jgi:UPF0042 nucleotide-binding protein
MSIPLPSYTRENHPLLKQENPYILIVTGYSGAGKSCVLRSLEDAGFFCVDNLPLALLDSFFNLVAQSPCMPGRVGLGLDIRAGQSLEQLVLHINRLRTQGQHIIEILFLRASTAILVKRFGETRRTHPLALQGNLTQACLNEQQALMPLIDNADIIIDTDELTVHQLRALMKKMFNRGPHRMVVHLISFGFKYGIPPESNFIFDVRSLPNPYFNDTLRPLNGTDSEITDFLFAQDEVQEYWYYVTNFLSYCVGKAQEEGRVLLSVAIGCTGGKHRSVAFIEKCAQLSFDSVDFIIKHRDMNKDS